MATKNAEIKKAMPKGKPQPVAKPPTFLQMLEQQGRNIDRLADVVAKLAASVYLDQPEPGPQECNTAAPSPRASRNDVKQGSIPMGSSYLSAQLSLAEETLDKLLSRLEPLLSSQSPAASTGIEGPQPSALCEVADRLITSGNRVSRLQVAIQVILDRLEI